MEDLKALDPDVHHLLTGRGNTLVLESIQHLYRHGRLAEVRLLLVPGFNDTDQQLTRTADWLARLDPGLRTVVIGFRRHGVRSKFAHVPEAGADELDRARTVLEDAGLSHVVTV
jgi:pyruvate-formate lyase-activating enzyme